MYHRVATLHADPWQLAVSAENFEAHVKLLKQKYNVVTHEELLYQVSRKSFRNKQVCITFDDGYLDNYTTAKPILEKYQCPATFFISTYFLQKGQPYWWDELQELIFSSTKLPSPFLFSLRGEEINIILDDGGHLTEEQREKQNKWIWSDKPPTERCRLYFSLWEKMRPLPQQEIEDLLYSLKKMIGVDSVNLSQFLPMTISNLKEMSNSQYLHIGMHTHTHPVLSVQSATIQKKELVENKNILEEACGRPMQTLSYPHGRFNADTLSIAQELNIQSAFTTDAALVNPSTGLLEIPRYQVLDWSLAEFGHFMRRIWLG